MFFLILTLFHINTDYKSRGNLRYFEEKIKTKSKV